MSRGRDILPMKRPVQSVSHLYKCMHMHTHEITPLKLIQPLHLMTKRIRFISQKHKSTPLNSYLSEFTRAFSQHKRSAETHSYLGCFPPASGTRTPLGQQINLMAFIIFTSNSHLVDPLVTPTHHSCAKKYSMCEREQASASFCASHRYNVTIWHFLLRVPCWKGNSPWVWSSQLFSIALKKKSPSVEPLTPQMTAVICTDFIYKKQKSDRNAINSTFLTDYVAAPLDSLMRVNLTHFALALRVGAQIWHLWCRKRALSCFYTHITAMK